MSFKCDRCCTDLRRIWRASVPLSWKHCLVVCEALSRQESNTTSVWFGFCFGSRLCVLPRWSGGEVEWQRLRQSGIKLTFRQDQHISQLPQLSKADGLTHRRFFGEIAPRFSHEAPECRRLVADWACDAHDRFLSSATTRRQRIWKRPRQHVCRVRPEEPLWVFSVSQWRLLWTDFELGPKPGVPLPLWFGIWRQDLLGQ